MWFLYLDESGDLGFDFITKKPSKVFTVTILLIKDKNSRLKIISGVKKTLRKKLNPKSKRNRMVQELKANSIKIEIKKYFYKQIKSADFQIYSIALNKRRVYEHLLIDKSRVYNWVARLLLDNINFSEANTRIIFTLDKSKGKREIEEFNSYIYGQLKAKIDPKVPLEIKHLDSKHDYCLSAVDLFSWGVFRKFERKDMEWRDVFKDKIVFESVYLP